MGEWPSDITPHCNSATRGIFDVFFPLWKWGMLLWRRRTTTSRWWQRSEILELTQKAHLCVWEDGIRQKVFFNPSQHYLRRIQTPISWQIVDVQWLTQLPRENIRHGWEEGREFSLQGSKLWRILVMHRKFADWERVGLSAWLLTIRKWKAEAEKVI